MRIAQSLLGIIRLVVIVTHIEAQRGRIRARANGERVVRRGHEEQRFASIFVDLHVEFVFCFWFLFSVLFNKFAKYHNKIADDVNIYYVFII